MMTTINEKRWEADSDRYADNAALVAWDGYSVSL